LRHCIYGLSFFFIVCSAEKSPTSSNSPPTNVTDTTAKIDTIDTPGDFGLTTSAVIVINPKINQGSSTNLVPGIQREGIAVRADTALPVTTDSNGLAILTGILVDSMLPIIFANAQDTLLLHVHREKELYDVVVSFKNNVVEKLFPAIRYPIGGEIIILDTTLKIVDSLTDDAIIVLDSGIYKGNFEIRERGVLIFGAWDAEKGPLSVIDDNVFVYGGAVRMRGVKIQGKLTVRANDFEAAFCEFESADISGNGVMLLRNKFTVGQAIVPSSNAVLVDNENIP